MTIIHRIGLVLCVAFCFQAAHAGGLADNPAVQGLSSAGQFINRNMIVPNGIDALSNTSSYSPPPVTPLAQPSLPADPFNGPAPQIEPMPKPTPDLNTSIPLTKSELDNLKANQATIMPSGPPAKTQTNVAPSYAAPTFNPRSDTTFTYEGDGGNTPSATNKAASHKSNDDLAQFGVSRQEVANAKATETSSLAAPTKTSIWNAPGAPAKLIKPVPHPEVARRFSPPPQQYAPSVDNGSAAFAQFMVPFLLGVAQGAIGAAMSAPPPRPMPTYARPAPVPWRNASTPWHTCILGGIARVPCTASGQILH